MSFLLDTNVVIHLLNGHQPLTDNVMKNDPSILFISGFTEAEINYGIENSASDMKEQNRAARTLAMTPFNRVYHDESVSSAYGKIKAHLNAKKNYRPDNELDIFIAATAVAKNLVLVTNNVKDFSNIPDLKIEDWTV